MSNLVKIGNLTATLSKTIKNILTKHFTKGYTKFLPVIKYVAHIE